MLIFLASKLEAQPYVTWDDIKVNSNALDLNEEGYIKSQRVIVVDQNGNGDSVTVQGAIDTVPINNSDRIKIFIRPAIYRYLYIEMAQKYIYFL